MVLETQSGIGVARWGRKCSRHRPLGWGPPMKTPPWTTSTKPTPMPKSGFLHRPLPLSSFSVVSFTYLPPFFPRLIGEQIWVRHSCFNHFCGVFGVFFFFLNFSPLFRSWSAVWWFVSSWNCKMLFVSSLRVRFWLRFLPPVRFSENYDRFCAVFVVCWIVVLKFCCASVLHVRRLVCFLLASIPCPRLRLSSFLFARAAV